MIERGDKTTIVARDCSPIPIVSRDEDEWLRRLVLTVKSSDMLLHIGVQNDKDDEPIASFDSTSGTWWAGRYVGEVQFEGRTLRLEPRFGMPTLMRWLTTIWGVRILNSKGRYEQQRIWLWLVIAHLWASRLIAAAKHGLPHRRVENAHYGRSLRGRLLVRQTALIRAVGDDRLASITRDRVVDPVIGGILLAAFDRLRTALGPRGDKGYWLSERGRTLVDDLQAALGARSHVKFNGSAIIRYSPMTENFRSAVDLSISILAQRPHTPAAGGEANAFGVLIDMAEIWELYVAKILKIGLPGLKVSYTGRTKQHLWWLLRSAIGNDKFGSLRPDIIISDHRERCVAIADAKYKNNRINASNRTGVITDDLYQLTAYLSGFGEPEARLDGFLIYPADEEGQVAKRLSPKNPWKVSSSQNRNLWFVSTDCGSSADGIAATESEQALTTLIHRAIGTAT